MRRFQTPRRQRYEEMIMEECALWGFNDPNAALGRRHLRVAAYVRAQVYRKLLASGYNPAAIARVARRDHSTIHHSLDRASETELQYLTAFRDKTERDVKRRKIVLRGTMFRASPISLSRLMVAR